VLASERDLHALAAIVSEDRPDLPDGEGLSPSLLADLMGQIRCDGISLERHDSGRQETGFLQLIPVTQCGRGRDPHGRCAAEDLQPVHWQQYWDCQPCSYPDRTGDLCSIVKITDFYSARQWHSTGMYTDVYRPQGGEHEIQLFLPDPAAPTAGPSRTLRLSFFRGSGLDFSERDRAVLTLLRPHLYQACLDAERRRDPVPRLTPRQWELLHLLAAGHTNTQIARRLGISEGTVSTHLENIYERLHVSSRTAAVTRAFPDRVALPGSISARSGRSPIAGPGHGAESRA
jgi:DNA-binding CsgD family transcriptional regulator